MFRNVLGFIALVSFAVALCMGARAFAATVSLTHAYCIQ